ncbi:MAG: type II toxin-antitoxin system RelE/ParE family toxin [Candidatus Bathyarchaeia archaeon]
MPTPSFKRRYKNKSSSLQIKVDEAIRLLTESEDPNSLGRPKRGKYKDCYGYDLTDEYRIIFRTDETKHELHLLRVCTHRQVYR